MGYSQHHLRPCDATARPRTEVNCSISVSGATAYPLRCVPETPARVLPRDTPADLREVRGEGHGSTWAAAQPLRSATTLGRPRTPVVQLAARRRAATRLCPTRWTTRCSVRWSRTATHPVPLVGGPARARLQAGRTACGQPGGFADASGAPPRQRSASRSIPGGVATIVIRHGLRTGRWQLHMVCTATRACR